MNIKEELRESFKINEDLFYEMANIKRQRSGLSADIWVDSAGASRKVQHSEPRLKLVGGDYEVELTIESKPRIIALPQGVTEEKAKRDYRDAIKFVGKYYQINLHHL